MGARMRFVHSLRLATWREIHARWPVLLVFPLAMLLGLVLPTPWNDAWTGFALFVLAPPLLVLMAAQGGTGPDRYWRGLGVSALAHLGVLVGLHLLPVLLLVLSFPQASRPFQPDWLALPVHLYHALALVVVYASTLAARALTSGFRVLAGPLLAALVLAPATWANATFRFIPLEISLVGRLLVVGLLSLVLAVAWDRREGAWGASLRRPVGSVLGTCLGFVLVTTGLEAGFRMPFPFLSVAVHASDDGHSVAFLSPWLLASGGGRGRAWTWTDARAVSQPGEPTLWGRDFRLVEGVGYWDAHLEDGEVLVTVQRGTADDVVLTTPAGTARCTGIRPVYVSGIEDGVATLRDGSGDGGPAYALSVSHGCVPDPVVPATRVEIRSQGHRWSVQSDEEVLRKDGVPVEGLTRPLLGSRSNRGGPDVDLPVQEAPGPLSIVGDERGVLVRVGVGLSEGPGGRRLYHITADATRVLDERLEKGGQGYLPWPEGPGFCRRRDEGTVRCWDTAGEETLVERPQRERVDDRCWHWDQGQCVLTERRFFPSHGDPISLPEPLQEHIVMDPDHVRLFYDTHFIDLGPEGAVSTHY